MKTAKVFLSLLTMLVFLAGINVLAQREPIPMDPTAEEKPIVVPETSKESEQKRIREGTTFQNLKGSFRKTGMRTSFYPDTGNQRFVCLENLNLERILKSIEDKPSRAVWRIDGRFTEFQGANYLLIERAVVAPPDFAPQLGNNP